jgi:DNA polymerase III subunit beta
MRLTISREKLQEGLNAVTASIPVKTTLPVLANILVETTERGIKLSGTDLDIAASSRQYSCRDNGERDQAFRH